MQSSGLNLNTVNNIQTNKYDFQTSYFRRDLGIVPVIRLK